MEMNDAIKSLSALAQGSRLAIFRLLVQAGAGGLPAVVTFNGLDKFERLPEPSTAATV